MFMRAWDRGWPAACRLARPRVVVPTRSSRRVGGIGRVLARRFVSERRVEVFLHRPDHGRMLRQLGLCGNSASPVADGRHGVARHKAAKSLAQTIVFVHVGGRFLLDIALKPFRQPPATRQATTCGAPAGTVRLNAAFTRRSSMAARTSPTDASSMARCSGPILPLCFGTAEARRYSHPSTTPMMVDSSS